MAGLGGVWVDHGALTDELPRICADGAGGISLCDEGDGIASGGAGSRIYRWVLPYHVRDVDVRDDVYPYVAVCVATMGFLGSGDARVLAKDGDTSGRVD